MMNRETLRGLRRRESAVDFRVAQGAEFLYMTPESGIEIPAFGIVIGPL
jgi:hypothetical protein